MLNRDDENNYIYINDQIFHSLLHNDDIWVPSSLYSFYINKYKLKNPFPHDDVHHNIKHILIIKHIFL